MGELHAGGAPLAASSHVDPIARRWQRELRALGATLDARALERWVDELVRAPEAFGEKARAFGRERWAAGVSLADCARELAALAVCVEPALLPSVLEGMAQAAAAHARATRGAESAVLQPAPLEALLAPLEEALVVLDREGAVTLAGGALERLCEVEPHQLVGRRGIEVGRAAQAAVRARSTGSVVAPTLQRLADERTIEIAAEPLVGGGAVQTVRDRTERVEQRDALERADRELAALHARLLRGGHLQALGDIAAGTALALNNELNAIAMVLPLLRAESVQPRHLATIEAAVGRAAALVSRLQQLARPRRAGPARPLDLNAAVVEALDLVRPELTAAADDRRVRVDARLGEVPMVAAHGAELREVLCSLLVLARDALPSGGLLQVATRRAGERALVEVQHGDGAPAAADANADGRELALTAAREAASRGGGELTVERDARGAVYTLSLPLAVEAPAHKPPPPPTEPMHLHRARVLVVDDDAGNRETLSELLGLLGHEVETAATPGEALRLVTAHDFDAALVDLAMPEMNGAELARRLRAKVPSLRLAIVTGWEPAEAEADAPVEALFRKPIDLHAIQTFLDETGRSPPHQTS
jgi:CheY-like chemotaxis protein/signal transduction histidine kinase